MTKPGHEASLFDNAARSEDQLPLEFLPTPADGQLDALTPRPGRIERPEVVVDPSTPEAARPAVQSYLEQAGGDYDRVDGQGQTTAGEGTRQRAGIADPDDDEARAVRSARRILAANPPEREPKTRRGLRGQAMSNADGPPPHVQDSRKTY